MEIYDKLSQLDLLVFATVFLATMAFVWFSKLENTGVEELTDYIVMGRQLSLPLFCVESCSKLVWRHIRRYGNSLRAGYL